LLVDPDSTDGLVDAINTYYTDADKYNRLKLNCIKSITERFTWKAVTDKIVKNF
jgi:glycosyltransferase involved in cell wall biosynthesis